MNNRDTFWFIAQTGQISHRRPASPSNFYRYELHNKYLARVKLAVSSANITNIGYLDFTPAFLQFLTLHDQGDRRMTQQQLPLQLQDNLPALPDQVTELLAQGALFVINHSGGKDSQAMTSYLARFIPAEQMVIIHADLPGADWHGCEDHIRATMPKGVDLIVAEAVKTFEEMVLHRGMFPSPSQRQCTSDLKRGPLEREIRRYLKENPKKGRPTGNPLKAGGIWEMADKADWLYNRRGGVVVNCMGMRAQESHARAKLDDFKYSPRNSKAGRQWFDWLPIHSWLEERVWREIDAPKSLQEAATAAQAFLKSRRYFGPGGDGSGKGWVERPPPERPPGLPSKAHPAYGMGMKRLSCMFCIMGCVSDLRISAKANPETYARYVALERHVDHTLSMTQRPLDEVTGVEVDEELVAKYIKEFEDA